MTPRELFDSQNFTQRKQALKLLLNAGNRMLDKDEIDYFTLIINAHHASHFNTTFKKVQVIANPVYAHNNFFAAYIDEFGNKITSMVGVGHIKGTPKRSLIDINKRKSIQHMRFCIGSDIDLFKSILFKDDNSCKICGIKTTLDECHLDHCGDYEFKTLADIWLKDIDLETLLFDEPFGRPAAFMDTKLTDLWIEFHNSYARFQLTCPTCNLKKDKQC